MRGGRFESEAFEKTLDWAMHERIAFFMQSAVTSIHLLRTQARTRPTLQSTRDWFEEIDSVTTLASSILSHDTNNTLLILKREYEKLDSFCQTIKPSRDLFNRLQKIVELYQKILYAGIQRFNYFFKMEHIQRDPHQQIEQYVLDVYGEDLKRIKNEGRDENVEEGHILPEKAGVQDRIRGSNQKGEKEDER